MGQMFGINLASCCFTSNLDVTLGAFSKWFKYLHPLSAAEGTLRVERMAKDSLGCGDIAHNNRNGDRKGGRNGSRVIQAPASTVSREEKSRKKKSWRCGKSQNGGGSGDDAFMEVASLSEKNQA